MRAMATRHPLEGRTVVITASRRATEQATVVSKLGGSPYVVPTVGISLTLNSERTTVVARRGKPKEALARFGIEVDAQPPRDQATAEGIVALLSQRELSRKKVAILWHGAHSDSVREELLTAGVESVLECSTYAYSHQLDLRGADVLKSMGFTVAPPSDDSVLRLIDEIIKRRRVIDAITFTSPPAARHLFEIAEEHGIEEELRLALNEGVCIAAVGPSTKKAVEDRGVHVHVVPQLQAMGAMLTALTEYFEKRGD